MPKRMPASHRQQGGKWSLPGLPNPPTWQLDWPAWEAGSSFLGPLAGCRQDPVHHQEGDVLVHTRMVVEALVAQPAWRQLPEGERAQLVAAALLHDVGKATKTRQEPDGRLVSPGHSLAGARMVRRWLYRGEAGLTAAPTRVREAIVGLVRHHGLPLHALDSADPTRAVISASFQVRLDHLALLAEADILGRICPDRTGLLDRVELFRELVREADCADRPRPFASDLARYAYLAGSGWPPDGEPYDATWGEVVLLAGLPGAGKSTWLRQHLPKLPVVSLDALRASLGVAPSGDQGPVIARAKDLARDHLRNNRSFAWDATNVSRLIRDPLVALFAGYGARVRLVYLETPYAVLMARNLARSQPVPPAVIHRLIDRLDVPNPTEAHRVEWVTTDS